MPDVYAATFAVKQEQLPKAAGLSRLCFSGYVHQRPKQATMDILHTPQL